MLLSEYSKGRLKASFSKWGVDKDFVDPMYNYLVYGYETGSFFTAVLANDFMRAVGSSHPSNTITALKKLVGWINDYMPVDAYGSYTTVKEWCCLDEEARRTCLVQHHLIYTPKEETWKILKDDPVESYAYLEVEQ